jgi:hypothetical protein
MGHELEILKLRANELKAIFHGIDSEVESRRKSVAGLQSLVALPGDDFPGQSSVEAEANQEVIDDLLSRRASFELELEQINQRIKEIEDTRSGA